MAGSFHRELGRTFGQGWVGSGGFLSSVLSGFVLGYLADRWLGTDPWLVIVGIVAGSVSGFYQMAAFARRSDPRER